jgi:hypothetical protein
MVWFNLPEEHKILYADLMWGGNLTVITSKVYTKFIPKFLTSVSFYLCIFFLLFYQSFWNECEYWATMAWFHSSHFGTPLVRFYFVKSTAN